MGYAGLPSTAMVTTVPADLLLGRLGDEAAHLSTLGGHHDKLLGCVLFLSGFVFRLLARIRTAFSGSNSSKPV